MIQIIYKSHSKAIPFRRDVTTNQKVNKYIGYWHTIWCFRNCFCQPNPILNRRPWRGWSIGKSSGAQTFFIKEPMASFKKIQVRNGRFRRSRFGTLDNGIRRVQPKFSDGGSLLNGKCVIIRIRLQTCTSSLAQEKVQKTYKQNEKVLYGWLCCRSSWRFTPILAKTKVWCIQNCACKTIKCMQKIFN